MPKQPARKLKVFQTQLGFYDTVVAAPSQAAALRAWGVHQNLFASGEARIATDDTAIAAATAHPQTPLRRALGSDDPFVLEPAGLPKVPDAPKKTAIRRDVKPKPTPAKPAADRSKLDAAEKALEQLEARRKREEADLRREQDQLEGRRDAAQRKYVEARKSAAAKVASERAAYRRAGGTE